MKNFMKALFEMYWYDEKGVKWVDDIISGETQLSASLISEINDIIQNEALNLTIFNLFSRTRFEGAKIRKCLTRKFSTQDIVV